MWHSISAEEALEKLGSGPGGLSEQEAKKRLAEFGHNELPEEKPTSKIILFLRQFKNPLVYLLVVAGLITLFLKEYADTAIIFAAVFVNTIIGFFQENKTQNILAELKKIVKERAIVVRSGNQKEIDSSEVVQGDIIFFYLGDRIPADARLIRAHSLGINEASLTGEWIAAKKQAEKTPKDTPLADRDSMVYMGTLVEEGWGKAVVVETGHNTEIGKIASLVKETKEEKTPYQKKVAYFSGVLGSVILFLSAALFVLGVLTGKDVVEMLITSVAVAVAAIPEGLPAAVTVAFAFGMREILKKKGLVKELVAAEILGSTSVICTDKTGTLTEAKMQVAGIYAGARETLSDGHKYDASQIDGTSILALRIAVLVSNAFIENPEDDLHKWIVRGAPTDRAFLLAGIQAGLNKKELLTQYPEIDRIPFDPAWRYSATLHKSAEGENLLQIMGAPEVILKNSKYLEKEGGQEAISEEKLIELNQKIKELTSRGARVLAAAYKSLPVSTSSLAGQNGKSGEISDLVFVGLLSLRDPLRREAKKAVKICESAGMKPIIVTGDHQLTARAIAEELGISIKDINVMEGRDLDKITDENFDKMVDKIKIYARVEPRHKIRIVQAWQRKGEVVAMTGDGVNDSPALKQANIGVALGSGTEAAKEASDLILLSDNFDIIITAVEEGRRIVDNVRKVITYLLEGSFTEILLIALSVVFRLPLPLLPGQILWNNLIVDTPPAMALTVEKKEKDVMSRKPEKLDQPLLTKEMKVYIFIVGLLTDLILFGLFLWLLRLGTELMLARSIIFAGLAIGSLFLVYACRDLRKNIWQYNPFSNFYLNLSVILGLLMLISALHLPFLQRLLKTVALGWREWFIIICIGLLNLFLIELAKMILYFRRQVEN